MTKKDEPKKLTIDGDGGILTPEGNYEEYTGDSAHKELLDNPKYAVHVHERQINRIIELLEEVAGRVVALEDKLLDLDLNVRFKNSTPPEGPPEPPIEV
jgi:hypothetical protein|tara:strand:- start:118 stop:414 length:297 start_codon:yes stop_codon:yes gene_type:complete